MDTHVVPAQPSVGKLTRRQYPGYHPFARPRTLAASRAAAVATVCALSRAMPAAAARQCGESRVKLRHEGLVRTSTVYTPKSVCEGNLDVPTVLLLHCFGCPERWGIHALRLAVDALGWLLLLPDGIGRSWNAESCCGEALQRKLDDVGFIKLLVDYAAKELGTRRDALFVGGWSNGGFMTTRMLQAGVFPIRAAVATAGHVYNVSGLQNLGVSGTPVLLEVSKGDTAVRYEGCCRSGIHCCCNIFSPDNGPCVGAEAAVDALRVGNGCSVAATTLEDSGAGVRCSLSDGCVAATVFCTWESKKHAELGQDPVLCDALLFFLSVLAPPDVDQLRLLAQSHCRAHLPSELGTQIWQRASELSTTTLPTTALAPSLGTAQKPHGTMVDGRFGKPLFWVALCCTVLVLVCVYWRHRRHRAASLEAGKFSTTRQNATKLGVPASYDEVPLE